MRELLDRELVFRELASDKTFKKTLTKVVCYCILFLAVYGIIYGYWANEQSFEWTLKDLVKFPATFLLASLFSLPTTHIVCILAGCKGKLKHTFAIMISAIMIMSVFTLALGGVLVFLMGLNKALFDIIGLTHVFVIGLGLIIGAFYLFFGLKIVHGVSDSAAIALVLIAGIIYLLMLPQATGLIGPYSTESFTFPILRSFSGMWGAAELTKPLAIG